MVDWDEVERLREKGWDWDRIARDRRVNFRADPSLGAPGRALRILYRRRRRETDEEEPPVSKRAREEREKKWPLQRIALILTALFGLWAAIAWAAPSPVGVFVPALPYLALAFVVSAFVLFFSLWRNHRRHGEYGLRAWTRGAIAGGIVLGLVIAGSFGVAGIAAGYPYLPPFTTPQPQGWARVSVSPWQVNGVPVFFFYGSVACPFCSASSWAMWGALRAFGNFSGVTYGYSSSTDVYPSTPEVVLGGSTTYSSRWVSLQVAESMDFNTIIAPPTANPYQAAYVTAYSGGSIPFVVVNGWWVHGGSTLIDPAGLATWAGGANGGATAVANQVVSQSGGAFTLIETQMWIIEALIVKANGGHGPAAVLSNPNVQNWIGQFS